MPVDTRSCIELCGFTSLYYTAGALGLIGVMLVLQTRSFWPLTTAPPAALLSAVCHLW